MKNSNKKEIKNLKQFQINKKRIQKVIGGGAATALIMP